MTIFAMILSFFAVLLCGVFTLAAWQSSGERPDRQGAFEAFGAVFFVAAILIAYSAGHLL
jgi:hypothetical protein